MNNKFLTAFYYNIQAFCFSYFSLRVLTELDCLNSAL